MRTDFQLKTVFAGPSRFLASASIFAIAGPVLATPPVFGTKADSTPITTAGAPGVGLTQFLQMLVALAIVFVLVKYGMPKLLGSMNNKLNAKSGGSILVEESTPFAGGQLHVVNIRNRTLLLCSTTAGVTCLADLSETTPRAEKPLFMDMLSQETSNPSHLYVQADGNPRPTMRSSMSEEEIQAAIERLNRLGADIEAGNREHGAGS